MAVDKQNPGQYNSLYLPLRPEKAGDPPEGVIPLCK